jgi:hypothetical protein
MEPVTAKVLGAIALIFGLAFLVISVLRFLRPELDLFLIVVNAALGVLWLGAGVWLWRYALRKAKRLR